MRLPELAQRRAKSKRLRIWSAGCSTGQEVYSLAMLFAEEPEKWRGWTIDILGTDVSTGCIDRARDGTYSQFEVQRGLGINQMIKWFEECADGWRAVEPLRKPVRFQVHNLLEPPPHPGDFDIVLCRNVLLYLSPEKKTLAFERLAGAMAEDGWLMLGAGETVIGQTNRLGADINARGLYRLPATAAASKSAPGDRRAGCGGLTAQPYAVRHCAHGPGLYRPAFAQLRRAAAAGLDDRASLYGNARRRRRARPADLARSQGLGHYLVDEDGTIYRLVDEDKRAWHAGKSRWRGIERRQFGERRDRDRQSRPRIRLPRRSPTSRWPRSSRSSPTSRSGTASAAAMSSAIPTSLRRARKTPASFFPGTRSPSAASRLPSPTRDLVDPYWTDAGFLLALERFGYDVTDAQKAVIAFQRRFRPDLIDGIVDGECRAKLLSLLLPRPQ